ncbi:MAG: DNA polymerase III subunit beta [Thermocrinis sp.]|jgi:DNA polymerase-3 subunit beta|uniref:DNA polymerase III subunit beta n=1 Tax=Thermocrinis sp. TaxID=2024383 RepID=UPI003C0E6021
MRAVIDRKEFEEVLTKAKPATEKRSSLPVLNNFKLSAKEDRLSIYATDLENFLVFEVPARVEEEGEVSVNADKLTSIVKNLSSAEVYMELIGDKLFVRGGKSQFKLVCAGPSEFPEFPEVQCKIAIPSNLLLKGISKVGYALSKEDLKHALQGMYMASKDGKLHFVGSDGYRLALYMHEGIPLEEDLLLSRKSLKVLEKLLRDTIGEVDVGKDESFVHVRGEGWKLSVRLLEGEYPDYMAVIPTDYTINVLLDKAEFENALKRLSSIASAKAFPVKLVFENDVVWVEISDPEFGEGKDEVDVLESFNSEPMEVGFNGKYLLEALGEFDFERVRLKVIDPDSPVVLESANLEKDPYLCIIMPMRL